MTGLGIASAATNTSSSSPGDGANALIDKLAQKFNLNKSDVQDVFDEARTEHQAEMQQKLEERLDAAVSDGKITGAQKDKIFAKVKEIRTQHEADRDSMSNLTDEQRRTKMEQERTALKTWADENNIPEEYLHFVGMGGPRGPMGEAPDSGTASTTQN